MTFPKLIGLYIRTVRFIKLSQIYHRVKRNIFKSKLPIFSDTKNMIVRNESIISAFPSKNETFLASNKFKFLNLTIELEFPAGWHHQDVPLLWIYNLHYFEGIMGADTKAELKVSLINQWIRDNSSSIGIGWDPYPLSLRISNWVKWFWSSESIVTQLQLHSLFQQTKYLEKNLEYHLLGNHLLENSKALIFAGYFFGGRMGDTWLALGLKILKSELREQILDDGGHFELSPMYHSLMLELVLDILQLSKEELAPEILANESLYLTEIASSMSRWLILMCHTDGEIAYFNDSAVGIAEIPACLINRVNMLIGNNSTQMADELFYLRSSGYIRLCKKDALVLFDVADIGATYLPGHGHADTLSIEFSLFGKRLFVNTGTSEYGNGARRQYERSTAAHSTVEIDRKNSSEVWSGFRVGRRARVRNIQFFGLCSVSAEHDGYRYLTGSPIHQRAITLDNKALTIQDNISTPGLNFISRFHIHPNFDVIISDSREHGYFTLDDGTRIAWKAEADRVTINDGLYAEGFGKLIPMKTLTLYRRSSQNTKLIVNWP